MLRSSRSLSAPSSSINPRLLSEELKAQVVEHAVLNARYHEQEAKIIALAGKPVLSRSPPTWLVAGTDIQLGGNRDMMLADMLSDVEDEAERARITAESRPKSRAKRYALKPAGCLFWHRTA